MKILIATGIYPPELGGPATYAEGLASRLSKLEHSVMVLTYSNSVIQRRSADRLFGIVSVVRSGKISNYWRYFVSAFKEAKKADVVYSLDWFSAGVPLMCACVLRGKKFAVRVGGGYEWEKYLANGNPPVTLREYYATGLYKKYFAVIRFLITRVLRRATYVVFNSDVQRELFTKYYGLKNEAVRTIWNPIPVAPKGVSHDETKIGNEIVFAGRFIAMKNIRALLQAMVHFKSSIWKLVLIGSGPEESALRAFVEAEGLRGKVSFEPPLSHRALLERLSRAYLFVLPSWTDISPNQIFECQAIGVPFIITKENYLPLPQEKLLTINPYFPGDIAVKIEKLTDSSVYEEYKKTLQSIRFENSWDDVVSGHRALFNDLEKNKK
jgi:glycosyltransferase involved in cell wall biosynthesis